MKIGFAATNPCHVYEMARELHKRGGKVDFYSGYPRWKLRNPGSLRVRTQSARTLCTYALLRLPPVWRPSDHKLFRWQDTAFDRWVGRALQPCDFFHGIPGQCLEGFLAAKRLGARTVLNHATGPVRQWVTLMRSEFEAAGRSIADDTPYDDAYFEQADREYKLTDFHVAASEIVRTQLVAEGVDREKIAVVPYGADPDIFHSKGAVRPEKFHIVFAGAAGLRKGVPTLLEALEMLGDAGVTAEFFGVVLPEVEKFFSSYRGAPRLIRRGPVSQSALAGAFRCKSLLVLPSIEEGFGLAVVQALACGMPAIVTQAVGAGDWIRHRENGSIVPVKDPAALAAEMVWWSRQRKQVEGDYSWSGPASRLLAVSKAWLEPEA